MSIRVKDILRILEEVEFIRGRQKENPLTTSSFCEMEGELMFTFRCEMNYSCRVLEMFNA